MYAEFWIRFVAAFIDGLILSIPNFIVGMILGSVISGSRGNNPEAAAASVSTASAILNVIFIVVYLGYLAYFESSEKQATPGKMAMNIVVTDLNGQRISFMRAL